MENASPDIEDARPPNERIQWYQLVPNKQTYDELLQDIALISQCNQEASPRGPYQEIDPRQW